MPLRIQGAHERNLKVINGIIADRDSGGALTFITGVSGSGSATATSSRGAPCATRKSTACPRGQ